jgi:hypothetical protein
MSVSDHLDSKLHSVLRSRLEHQMLDVRTNGSSGNAQFARNLGIRESFRDSVHHGDFTWG